MCVTILKMFTIYQTQSQESYVNLSWVNSPHKSMWCNYYVFFFFLTNLERLNSIPRQFVPFLTISLCREELRFREVKYLVQCHAASKWHTQAASSHFSGVWSLSSHPHAITPSFPLKLLTSAFLNSSAYISLGTIFPFLITNSKMTG